MAPPTDLDAKPRLSPASGALAISTSLPPTRESSELLSKNTPSRSSRRNPHQELLFLHRWEAQTIAAEKERAARVQEQARARQSSGSTGLPPDNISDGEPLSSLKTPPALSNLPVLTDRLNLTAGSHVMASRPRTGRGTAGRDSSKDVDVEADIQAQVLEGLRKAKDYNEKQSELGRLIIALEEEIKSKGSSKFRYFLPYCYVCWGHSDAAQTNWIACPFRTTDVSLQPLSGGVSRSQQSLHLHSFVREAWHGV